MTSSPVEKADLRTLGRVIGVGEAFGRCKRPTPRGMEALEVSVPLAAVVLCFAAFGLFSLLRLVYLKCRAPRVDPGLDPKKVAPASNGEKLSSMRASEARRSKSTTGEKKSRRGSTRRGSSFHMRRRGDKKKSILNLLFPQNLTNRGRDIEQLLNPLDVVESPGGSIRARRPIDAIGSGGALDKANSGLASSSRLLLQRLGMATPGSVPQNMMSNLMSWGEFDVFELHKATEGHSLTTLALAVYDRYNLGNSEEFSVPVHKFEALMLYLDESYSNPYSSAEGSNGVSPFESSGGGEPDEREWGPEQDTNPYHNSMHAADVLQAIVHCFTLEEIMLKLEQTNVFQLVVAAAMHDFRHLAVTNSFLITSSHVLAIQYSDKSVLEHFHLYQFFDLIRNPDYDIVSGTFLSGESEVRKFRRNVIKLVIATDLALGRDLLESFSSQVADGLHDTGSRTEVDQNDRIMVVESVSRTLLMQIILKFADVSHGLRPRRLHYQWCQLIVEEFFTQGQLEREAGMPVTAMCDEVGFLQWVVRPIAEAVQMMVGKRPEWILDENIHYWKCWASESNAKLLEPGTFPENELPQGCTSLAEAAKAASKLKAETEQTASTGIAKRVRRLSAELRGAGRTASERSKEKLISRRISQTLAADNEKSQSTIKILILGCGGCGKSTLLKQMKLLHGNFLTSEEERQNYVDNIRLNLLDNLGTLVRHVSKEATDDGDGDNDDGRGGSLKGGVLLSGNVAIAEKIFNLHAEKVTSPSAWFREAKVDISDSIALWNDPAVQSAWEDRFAARIPLETNAEYLFGRIDAIVAKDYKPVVDDILRVRVPTRGFVEAMLNVSMDGPGARRQSVGSDLHKMKIVDVGGQKNERRKWIHLFDHVSAIVFVSSLSDYCSSKKQEKNTFLESLKVFKFVMGLPFFTDTPVVVFLNKVDIFKKQMKKSPVHKYLKGAPQKKKTDKKGALYAKHLDYFADLFIKARKQAIRDGAGSPEAREKALKSTGQMRVFPSTATDTTMVQDILSGVFESILHKALDQLNVDD